VTSESDNPPKKSDLFKPIFAYTAGAKKLPNI
jgi:hypothetical protein